MFLQISVSFFLWICQFPQYLEGLQRIKKFEKLGKLSLKRFSKIPLTFNLRFFRLTWYHKVCSMDLQKYWIFSENITVLGQLKYFQPIKKFSDFLKHFYESSGKLSAKSWVFLACQEFFFGNYPNIFLVLLLMPLF